MLATLLLGTAAWATTTVAVVGATSSESSSSLAAQLNDDTYFDFDATVVSPGDVDSATELAAYDVVIIGGSGQGAPTWTKSFVTELDTWVRGGGGLVTLSWFHYTTDLSSFESTIDGLTPISMTGNGYEFCSGSGSISVELTTTSHPITDGIKDFTLSSSNNVEISTHALPKGAEALMTASSTSCSTSGTGDQNAVSAWEVDFGNVAYLGLLYSASSNYNNTDLRSGDADQLLEQAVDWAASGGDADGDGYSGADDCDEDDPAINVGAKEIWYDGIDQNCDEWSDYDQDLDGYDAVDYGGDDCDDADPDINPIASEVCDGEDNDCDSVVPDDELDSDGDGFSTCEGDCDDADGTASPTGAEVADVGIDEDCDGADLVTNDDGGDDDKGAACAHASPGHALSFVLLGGLIAVSRRRRD